MKIAANLSLLWPELPFLDRFEAAAAAGFDGVEVMFPYEFGAREMQASMRRAGLPLILLNAPPPNYTGGLRGFAATPGREDRFQHDMRRVFRYADALGARFIHIMAGEGHGDEAFDTLVSNLKWASRQAPKGLTLTIEPLNKEDMPGYFLTDYAQTARVLDAVKKPNVRLQFDSYHAQIIHGDAVNVWKLFGIRAAHAMFGDTPGRNAPGEGEIDFDGLLQAMAQTNYAGWISGKYHTGNRPTEDSLKWLKDMKKKAA